MEERASRRRYLQAFGATLAVGAAGCTDSGDNDTANSDGSDTDDGSTDDGTDDGSDDGSTDDGADDNGDTDDGSDDDGDTDDDDGTDDSDGEEDGDDDTAPRLADVLNWTDSYVMEISGDDFDGTWRFNDGNWQLTATADGETSETYSISTDSGRDTYVVTQGQCFKTESTDVDEDRFDLQEPAEDDIGYVASGRTTIDGQDVYTFEIDEGVYYVSVETGYPVRYEGADGTTVNFRSWGETDPITPPDMECFER